MNRKLILRIFLLVALVVLVVVFRPNGPTGAYLSGLAETGLGFFVYATVAGIVDSINPCAFSVLLLTVGFLFSLGRKRSSIIKIGSVYIFGVFLVYLLIGLFVGQFLNFVKAPHIMAKIGALVLVLVGLVNILNDFFPKFPIKLKIPELSHRKIASLL
ncbi:MAG: hypothetical protein Q8N81_02195, partial [bacterium]|nr:hypothetical protein [bacterium]